MDWKDEEQVKQLIENALFQERYKTEQLIRNERDRYESNLFDRLILLAPAMLLGGVLLKFIFK